MSTWTDLIEAEAVATAERENEAEGHCGPYGTSTAADYRDEITLKFEDIGRRYLQHLIQSEQLGAAIGKLTDIGDTKGWNGVCAPETVKSLVLALANPNVKYLDSYINDMDDDGYVPFNADRSLDQNQYASRYVHGRIEQYPNLGDGLRWKNRDSGNYHSIRIHLDDLNEFHRRVRALNTIKGD